MSRCLCGATNCRGTMDVRPDRTKDFGKRVEVFWEGDRVYYRGTVMAFNGKSNTHQILYDDNDVEKVNLNVCSACAYPCMAILSLHVLLPDQVKQWLMQHAKDAQHGMA